MLLVEAYLSLPELIYIRDIDVPHVMPVRLKRQVGKYLRIRDIYFGEARFDYLFLDEVGTRMDIGKLHG